MIRRSLLTAAVALSVGFSFGLPTNFANADGHSFSDSDLGGALTPVGAIRAGNEDGSIPEWTGGVTEPPVDYSAGGHHTFPFEKGEPLFTITGSNADQYRDLLTEGHYQMLQQYPSYSMPVYETHRTAAFPQRIYDETMANAARGQLSEDGNGVLGAKEGFPFPVPETGLEVIWNHLLRFRGVAFERRVGQANPTAGGDYTMVFIEEQTFLPYSQPGGNGGDNILAYFQQFVVEPARLAGEVLLVHETLNQVAVPRQAWTYNPGQRRVRRAPNVAYDNPGTAADGLRTTDNFDMFSGAPDRYQWELVGRKEMIVPYNAYALHAPGVDYDEIIKAGHLNPDYLRYEKHRVWVVEATLKDGISNIYSRRTFYIDEDSWNIVSIDHYDSRGDYWRLSESHGLNYYDVPVYYNTVDIVHDLQSGRYTAIGFNNNEWMIRYGQDYSRRNFTPEQLRRSVRR
ncbi:MAG: DUF1329 domain-containing protein [Alphaproteobacteria bacterium]|nr:DUF1329 domain-containing protein [Alphaproteobacteria bacterium SS10]